MVKTIDGQASGSHDARQEGSRLYCDIVPQVLWWVFWTEIVSQGMRDVCGDVLIQCTTQGDVEYLQATAYSQYGLIAVHGIAGQEELDPVLWKIDAYQTR